jgi:polyisoprenoid-binding protein YceI
MKKILLILVILSSLMYAELTRPKTGCILSQQGDVKVSWKAYKTPSKIEVSGIFNDVIYTAVKKEGKNFKEILVGSSVVIKTVSVNSKNKERDTKLVNAFFGLLSGKTITAKIVDMTSNKRVKREPRTGTITLEVTMNGVTKNVPMTYSYDKGLMKSEGFIDIFDFAGSKALASLNKACFDKHQGKTWSDVKVGFEMNIKAILCAVKH